jgi:hypothetical protein
VSDHWSDANDRSRNMRMMLAREGIELDEPTPTAISSPRTCSIEPNRDVIRAYLEPLGCPEWAIMSCPSLELARTYRSLGKSGS